MDYKKIINTLKGISGIISETHMAEILWRLQLLNRGLMKCISALEANIQQ